MRFDDATRSQWEKEVVAQLRSKYPNLVIETNNRNIIPSRKTQQYLEIDIFIPSLRLGIELNGEQYHNHSQYLNDKRNGTTYSDEAYKERACDSLGILLINVWSGQGKEDSLNEICSIIDKRLNDSTVMPYVEKPALLGNARIEIPTWLEVIFFIVAVPLWGFAALIVFATFMRSFVDGNSSYDIYLSSLPIMMGSFAAALVCAFGHYLENKSKSIEAFSKGVIVLVLVFGVASGLCLYTQATKTEPFNGYHSAEYYKERTPLNKVSVGKLCVENDLPYLSIGGHDSYESIQTAIVELGYEGDPLAIYGEAFNTSGEALTTYEPPRSLWNAVKTTDRVYGFATFGGNGEDYTLLVTTYSTDEGKKYSAYIYED